MKSQRKPNQLRSVTIEPFPSNAPGSILISQGNTRVICTASIADDVPSWLKGKNGDPPTRGWVTAEYNMLPGSTNSRKRRGNDGRGTEIQRLIARALRASIDLEKMPGIMITCDCDVIQADGGTRTASITGAFVALAQAIKHAQGQGRITTNPILGHVAAVSVGIIDNQAWLDLDYPLDVRAEVDMNIAMNHKGDYVEVQGTGEAGTFSRDQLNTLLDLADKGIRKLMTIQRKALKS